MGLVLANWKVIGAVLLVLTIGGYVGAQNRQINLLQQQIGTMVKVIDQKDLQRLQDLEKIQGTNAELVRMVGDLKETLRIVASRPGSTTIERIIERQTGPQGSPGTPGRSGESIRGPAGPTGQPASPGTGLPGTPLIPPAEAPAARVAAIETVRLFFDPGTLVNCDVPGQEPNTVEVLRDPSGALKSTAPCVWRISDRIVLKTPNASPTLGLPYHLGLIARAGTNGTAFTGIRYVNRGLWNTLYEVEAGHAFPGWSVNLTVVVPLR